MILSTGSVLAYADQAQPADATPSYYLGNSGLPGAEARAAHAKANYDQAYADLRQTVADVRQNFTASSDYQSARQELIAAQSDYDKAAEGIKTQLANDSVYKQLSDARTNIETQLSDATLSPSARLDLATRKMRLSTAIAGMETKAWTDSPDAQQAKTRLSVARLAMKQMIDRFEASLPNDPKVAAAKTALDSASVEKAEAYAYLNGTIADKVAAANQANAGYGNVNQNSYPFGNGNSYYGYDYGNYPYYFGGYDYGFGFPTIYVTPPQHHHDHDHNGTMTGQNPMPGH
jgi:hypothetical protein